MGPNTYTNFHNINIYEIQAKIIEKEVLALNVKKLVLLYGDPMSETYLSAVPCCLLAASTRRQHGANVMMVYDWFVGAVNHWSSGHF